MEMNELWTVQDIADFLKVCRNTVYSSVVCKPDFPKPVKVGCGKRWFPEEVVRWLNQRRAA